MLEQKILNIVAMVLEVPIEHISKNSSADNIDSWDSLKQMNLMMTLEQEFAIEFTEEDVFTLLDCELLIQRVRELITQTA